MYCFNENSKTVVNKKIVAESIPKTGKLLSGNFTREKKDCNNRMILNFEGFSKFIKYIEHEIKIIVNAIGLKLNVFMVSIN